MLAALSQSTRLRIIRAVAAGGPEGTPAGEIARAVRCPASTLSFHLKELSQAGLLAAEPQGRFIRYSLVPAALRLRWRSSSAGWPARRRRVGRMNRLVARAARVSGNSRSRPRSQERRSSRSSTSDAPRRVQRTSPTRPRAVAPRPAGRWRLCRTSRRDPLDPASDPRWPSTHQRLAASCARGWLLVDTGMDTADVRNAWLALEERLPLHRELKGILITHHHPDHFGMARWLADRHGVPVQMTRAACAAANRSLASEVERRADAFRGLRDAPWTRCGRVHATDPSRRHLPLDRQRASRYLGDRGGLRAWAAPGVRGSCWSMKDMRRDTRACMTPTAGSW